MTPFQLIQKDTLTVLENIGRDLALLANPQHYSCENRGRAKDYERPLTRTREAYKAIRHADNKNDILAILGGLLTYVYGIEGNFLRLLIGYVRGEEECRTHPSITQVLGQTVTQEVK